MTTTDAPTTEQPTPRHRRGLGQRRNVIIGIVLVAGFALGVGLVLIPGDDDSTTPATDATAPRAEATPLDVDVEDLSAATVEELTGLVFPASAEGFQSAITEDLTQLDVTFDIPESAEAEFLEASGLAEPVEGERKILHSSPMWKLNAGDDDAVFRGVADETDQVRRAVELVSNDDGTTTVRIVITAV